ncbi:hypothetical protein EV177_000940 [Coemansia sp. RSA 1804]|nr:hypothetical protein EV177_000940 [Coemansia sp. RSA 1804]
MARPEQAAGHKFQSFTSGFGSTSPFSQPPKSGSSSSSSAGVAAGIGGSGGTASPPTALSPGAPPHSASASATAAGPMARTLALGSAASPSMARGLTTGRMSSMGSDTTHSPPFGSAGSPRSTYTASFGQHQQNQHQHQHQQNQAPQPPSSAFAVGRRASGYLPPEKTAVGRSGVFDNMYGTGAAGGGDPYYRRHSVDMGISAQHSPPRSQLQRSPQHQQQHQQHQQQAGRPVGGSPHGLLSAPGRYGSRSGAASPHPLSFDQTASELSPSRTNTGSPNSPGERGVKRSAPDSVFGSAGAGRVGALDADDADDDEEDDEDEDDDLRQPHSANRQQQLGMLGTGRAGVATAEKPYACDQCELTFSRQHNLKSHALTHSTERPFSCNVCQTPFRRQHDLKRHMKLHTGEKPYKCTNCDRSFARLDALNRHMRAENFHACNQAAKKARTSVMVLDRASRLKSGSSASASVAYLEQRRASTTTTAAHHQYPPPGSSPASHGGGPLGSSGSLGVGGGPQTSTWSHWTHRPSIAADEAMLRRMHERFGAPPSYAASASTAASTPAAPLAPIQTQQTYYSPSAAGGAAHKQQSSAAAATAATAASAAAPLSHHHAQSFSAPYASSADPRAYGPAQQPPAQQYAGSVQQPPSAPAGSQRPIQPASRYRSDDDANAAAHASGAPMSAIAYPLSSTEAHLALAEEGSIPGATRGSGGGGGDAATTPPPPSDSIGGGNGNTACINDDAHKREDAGSGNYSRAGDDSSNNLQQQPMHKRMLYSSGSGDYESPFGRRGAAPPAAPAPAQKPPASFVNYTPSAVPRLHHHHQTTSGAASASSGMAMDSGGNGVATGATGGPKDSKPADIPSPRHLAMSRQPGYFYPGHQQYTTPLASGNKVAAIIESDEPGAPSETVAAAAGSTLSPHSASAANEAAVQSVANNNVNSNNSGATMMAANSRRESAYSATTAAATATATPAAGMIIERIADTRRSSIIALTNPQSEDDLRTENMDLKRRIDEMETKHLKEVDRLNQIIHELEIEKSLLKSLLIEKGDGGSGGGDGTADAAALMSTSGLKKRTLTPSPSALSSKRDSIGTIDIAGGHHHHHNHPQELTIKRQQSLSEVPLAQSVATPPPSSSATGRGMNSY